MEYAQSVYNAVGLTMSDKKAKTIEDRLVDVILPLFVWAGRKAFGSLFTSIEWHQIATSLVPPPDYLRSNIIRGYKAWEDYAAYAIEAVHRSSVRLPKSCRTHTMSAWANTCARSSTSQAIRSSKSGPAM